MKKLGILLLACITALNLWAEEFKIGKFTFKTITPTTVKLIGADADITNVFLSETIDYEDKTYTITSIGDQAFYSCSSMISITIPNSVTNIGYEAFVGCSALKSVTIPNSVTSIENYAFLDCSSLTSITIPNSVTSIGGWAFKGTALYNNSANWENGALYIDDWLIKVDEGFVGHYKVRENTRVIASRAFQKCSLLRSVNIPNTVIRIGDLVFYNCSSLVSITIPNSVTSIGEDAFRGCSSLVSITIPNSVTSIGIGTFQDCSSLSSVTIPNSVSSFGDAMFYNCSSLTSIIIPRSVTKIGFRTFCGCSSLVSITIPNSVTSIEDFAFQDCSSLTSVTIPNSVTSIGDCAFYDCESLTSVTIPKSVTSIGYDAFEGTALYNNPANWENGALYINDCLVKVDEGFVGHFRIKENTRVISVWALSWCESLTSVTIPKSVTSIGEEAFPSHTKIIRQ